MAIGKDGRLVKNLYLRQEKQRNNMEMGMTMTIPGSAALRGPDCHLSRLIPDVECHLVSVSGSPSALTPVSVTGKKQ